MLSRSFPLSLLFTIGALGIASPVTAPPPVHAASSSSAAATTDSDHDTIPDAAELKACVRRVDDLASTGWMWGGLAVLALAAVAAGGLFVASKRRRAGAATLDADA